MRQELIAARADDTSVAWIGGMRGTVLIVVAMCVAGALWQLSVPTGSDVSWLIDVAGRVWNGERLYVDVIESNPPFAVFIYMPAVLVERATGIAAETAQILITTLVACGSLALAAEVLVRCGLGDLRSRFLIAGAFAFMILPRYAFSQREHLAIMLMLPMLALMFARAEGVAVSLTVALLAGLGGGLGAAIKPHFVLVLAVPLIYASVARRAILPALRAPENWVAVGVGVALVAIVALWFPTYLTDIMPMEADTYLQVRVPLLAMLLAPKPLALEFAAITGLLLVPHDRGGRFVRLLLVASIAAIIVFFLQGKSWAYQLLPALSLVFIVYLTAVLPLLSRHAASRLRMVAATAGFVAIVPLVTLCSFNYFIALPLVPEIRAVAAHPRLFALSDDIGIGHPLTRMVDGTWVGRVCSQLIESSAEWRRDHSDPDDATRLRLAKWIDWDRNEIRWAIAHGHPDAIVVDNKTFDLAGLKTARPDIAALLADYTKSTSAGTVDLLVRRELVGSAHADLPR